MRVVRERFDSPTARPAIHQVANKFKADVGRCIYERLENDAHLAGGSKIGPEVTGSEHQQMGGHVGDHRGLESFFPEQETGDESEK